MHTKTRKIFKAGKEDLENSRNNSDA